MYIDQVKSLLKQVPKGLGKIAAYDTGFGLSICPDLGDGWVDTISVVSHRVLTIRPPEPSPQWDTEWEACKRVVNAFVTAYNEEVL